MSMNAAGRADHTKKTAADDGAAEATEARASQGEGGARQRTSGGSDSAGMFAHLLASKPGRHPGASLASTLVSVAGHGVVIAGVLWATLAVGGAVARHDENVTIVELPPAVKAPPPPAPPKPKPVVHVAPKKLKGFQTISVPKIVPEEIPPPRIGNVIREEDFGGVGVHGGTAKGKVVQPEDTVSDIAAAPQFTPFTVAPRVTNTAEVVKALVHDYPVLLRNAGIGGVATVWFLVDENGRVIKRQLDKGSGYPELDAAALKVADIMRFTPGYNRDQKVPVWISIPIRFAPPPE